MVSTLATRDPATALRQIEHDAQAGALELITENAIHRWNQRVRHALEFEGDVIHGELLGVEDVRVMDGCDRAIHRGRCGQRLREFRAEGRTDSTVGNGRGDSPGLLSGNEFESH